MKVEQNKTTRVEEPVSDDNSPKIAPRCKDQQSHQNAERAGDRDAERILVSVRCSEERALHQHMRRTRRADDFLGVDPQGRLYTKQQMIDETRNAPKYFRFESA